MAMGRAAQAYDQDERRQLRKAHFDAVKNANERHQGVVKYQFGAAIRQAQAVDWSKVTSPTVYVPLLSQLVRLEREILGFPLHLEITHGGPGQASEYDEAVQAASADAEKRFAASPELYAEVVKILCTHENKPDPPADDETEAAAPSDPSPGDSESEFFPVPATTNGSSI